MVVLAGSPSAKSRRSLYVLARRHYHLSLLGAFDEPTMSMNCPKREQSAVVAQSLMLLNDALVIDASQKFAVRVVGALGPADTGAQIGRAFQIALSRRPSEREMAWSHELVSEQSAELSASEPPSARAEKSLAHLCHMLLGSNEFLYVP
jgi:hypothetical protein